MYQFSERVAGCRGEVSETWDLRSLSFSRKLRKDESTPERARSNNSSHESRQGKTSGPPDERAHVYFRKTLPYEHRVVRYEDLHPELRDHIDEIRADLGFSKRGITCWGSVGAAIIFDKMHAPVPHELISGLVLTYSLVKLFHMALGAPGLLLKRDHPASVSHRLERIARLHKNPFVRMFLQRGAIWRSIALLIHPPYVIETLRTKRLGKVIAAIGSREESPFHRPDASELLRDYHYGAVDNRGNLILLKHPCDVFSKRYSPLQLLFKRLLWRLPQRPRFLLNKPQMRERVKRPARVSTRALQPVRVVARFE